MDSFKCPSCGHENIVGSDHCGKCLYSFTHKDTPQPSKNSKFQTKIMTEKVSDFISKIPPIIVSPHTPVGEVIEKMQAAPTKGCVLICGPDRKLMGIASIRDILLKVAGTIKESELSTYPVSKIMTAKPECLDKDVPLSYAMHMMSIGKFRHVPILDNGIPVGVVSTRDVIEYLAEKK